MERIGTKIKGKDVGFAGTRTADQLRRLAAYHLQREEVLAAQGRPQMAREARRQYKRYQRNAQAARAAKAHLMRGKLCSGPCCGRQIAGDEIRFDDLKGHVFCTRRCMESYYWRTTEKDRASDAVLI